MNALGCTLPTAIEGKEFAKPRRCAQRLVVNTEKASGVESLATLLNPVKQELTSDNQPSNRGARVPRCFSKIGPKPTALQVPSSFEESSPVTPPPPPKLSREERDAKHKLLLLLWESYRYQRKQMRALYSSSASTSSSANTSTLNSGGSSPQHRTPPIQHVSSPMHAKSPFGTSSSPSLLFKPKEASQSLSPSGLLYQSTGPSRPSLDSPLLSPKPGSSLTSKSEELRVPKPTAAPESLSLLCIPTDIEHQSSCFDNLEEEKLLQHGVDKLTDQWKEMVGQLDQIWNLLDGDTEAKYAKLKMRITSMLLWENLNVSRSMLTPPLDAIRQMNEDHERRLLSLPRGSLFHHPADIVEIDTRSSEGVVTPRFRLPT